MRGSMYRFAQFVSVLLVLNSSLTAAPQVGAGSSTAVDGIQTPGAPKLLPGTRANVLTTIQGNALNSTNGPLANNVLRLRDARFGRIVATVLSDNSGIFA